MRVRAESRTTGGVRGARRRPGVVAAVGLVSGLVLVFGGGGLLALGQATGGSEPKDAGTPGATGAPVPLDQIPPPLRLGARTALVQQRLHVIPTLVLVPDERSYRAAIRAWTTTEQGARRFPVLIDRGTYADQQRIARFVRAFQPGKVVRWTAPAAQEPTDRAAKQREIQAAVNAAWGAEGNTPEALRERWTKFGFIPPGVVVSWGDDPAWTAALALAAGRGQPLIWLAPRGGGPGNLIALEEARALAAELNQQLKGVGYAFEAQGDAIDAVTFAQSLAVKILLPAGDKRQMLATTDFIGRDAAGKRFAWAGQIEGDSAQAAYVAMCSLFLTRPARAWFFDGYDATRPWNAFDATQAGDKAKDLGVSVEVDDAPSGGSLTMWRARAGGKPGEAFGVSADLIGVNTSGNPGFFELKPGNARPGDVPGLRTPAAVHFVHSWSANNPRDGMTVGGAWLERGASLYVGSVHEPFLQAFVPTPLLVQRLGAGLPWGVAARIDDGEVWKVAVLGDPLMTAHPPAKRVDEAVPLAGAADVSEQVPELLKAKDFAAAAASMARLGRDRDVARLAAALLRERPGDVNRAVAQAAFASVYFSGDLPTLMALAPKIVPEGEAPQDPAQDAAMLAEVRAMVWHAVWPARQTLGAEGVRLLNLCLRREGLVEDAGEVIGLVRLRRITGLSPRDVVIRAQRLTNDRATADALDKLDD